MKTSSNTMIALMLSTLTLLTSCGTKEDALIEQDKPVLTPPKPVVVIDSKEIDLHLHRTRYALTLYFNKPQGPQKVLTSNPHAVGILHAINIIQTNAHLINRATVRLDKKACGDRLDKPFLAPIHKNIVSNVMGTYNIPVLIQNCTTAQDLAWHTSLPE